MSAFVMVAALMAAIAAAAVAVPLLKFPHSRRLGVVAALLVMGAAAGLYPLWSNWDWHAPTMPNAAQDAQVLARASALEKHLQSQPGDEDGWLSLGHMYMSIERPDDAIIAYEHAYSLDSKNATAAIGLGQALALRGGGEISAPAARLFEEALALAPNNPEALFFGGFAAAVRGDNDAARQRWQALKELHPPAPIEQMLDARLAELTAAGASGTNALPAGTNAGGADSAPVAVTVNISVAPALKARVNDDTPLFIYAREPGQPGPPLAAKRMTAAAIGTAVKLSSADSMIAGRVLRDGQRVSITARVSFGGQPTPVAGDLFGEATYQMSRDGSLNLVIDQVAK